MDQVKNIKQFIQENFETTDPEIFTALSCSNTLVYENEMVCIMNDQFIYYFGTTPEKRRTKAFYKFYKRFNLKNKDFVSKNTRMYQSLVKKGIINQIQ